MRAAADPHPPVYLAPVLQGGRALRYTVLGVLWAIGTGYFWGWWLQPGHILNPYAYWTATLALIWLYAMQFYFMTVFLMAQRSVAPLPEPGRWRVAMIVTKTPSEPFEVLRHTLEAMLAQDYPHDTWLADEDPQPETEAWCTAHGVRISSRKGVAEYHRAEWPRRTRCKEGNLAYFYDHWGYRDYDIVSQLDADHVPQPGYLREVLRPFADPGVGYVTAPSICSANAGQSWAARTRLYSEAAFHGVFQSGYTGALAPMCIGSHYAVRTAALKQVGGLGPELAEDHSTTMLMNAGGWRGVHAIDAIAYGDGPANVADLATQEFQWSRSLLSLFLRYTPRYLPKLPLRLKFLFVLCQLWYPIFAAVIGMMFVMPIAAILFDIRFADVTYPGFIGHSLPAVTAMIVFAYSLRRDGFFRPRDAHVIAWEHALFLALKWPWVFWGCAMAIRDRITGKFVDFRITPKGAAARHSLPWRIVAVYAGFAAFLLLPVLLVGGVTEARGFYLLSVFNALLYTIVVGVIVLRHLWDNGAGWRGQTRAAIGQIGVFVMLVALLIGAVGLRGKESLHALLVGLEPFGLSRVEYAASGAGSNKTGEVRFRFDPHWN